MTQVVVDTLVAVDSVAVTAGNPVLTLAIVAAVAGVVVFALVSVAKPRGKNVGGGSSNEPPTDNPRAQ